MKWPHWPMIMHLHTNSGPSSGQSSSSGKNPSSGSQSSGSQHTNKWGRILPVCYYCRKPGHVISECRIKKRDESSVNSMYRGSPNGKREGLGFSNKSVLTRSPIVDKTTDQFSRVMSERNVGHLFLMVLCPLWRVLPMKILHDTGATQSSILEKTLPFFSRSATGEFVIVQDIEGD